LRRSFFSHFDRLRAVQRLLVGKSIEEIKQENAAEGPPYELLLNLEGSELSELNARATLREIAENATVCEHELLLHGIRMLMVAGNGSFEQSLRIQLQVNEYASGRIDRMKADGYWERKVRIN